MQLPVSVRLEEYHDAVDTLLIATLRMLTHPCLIELNDIILSMLT